MGTVTFSSNYQIIIPSEIIKMMDLKPGSQFWVMADSGIIKLVPVIDIMNLRGTLDLINTSIEREEEDRI